MSAATFSHGLYAAPGYLQKRGVPPEPEALMEHDSLQLLTRSGELMPLLVDWFLPSAAAWAVFPGRRLMPARTRVFLDALQAASESLRQERIRLGRQAVSAA